MFILSQYRHHFLPENVMKFDDIKKALIDLLEDGKPDTFVSMMSEDFEMLSIHKSSVGAQGKNREEAIEMMNKLETIADANVKCQIQTPNTIVVTHNSINGEITLAANQIKDGKINKCVYFRGPK